MWFFIWIFSTAVVMAPMYFIGAPFCIEGQATDFGTCILLVGSVSLTYFICKKLKEKGMYPTKKEKPPKVINHYYYINNKGEVRNDNDDEMDIAPPPEWIKQERNKAKKLRPMILARDNYTCQKCGNSLAKEPNLLLEVDHIIPISKWGASVPENLQTLCWKCNRSKGAKIDT